MARDAFFGALGIRVIVVAQVSRATDERIRDLAHMGRGTRTLTFGMLITCLWAIRFP